MKCTEHTLYFALVGDCEMTSILSDITAAPTTTAATTTHPTTVVSKWEKTTLEPTATSKDKTTTSTEIPSQEHTFATALATDSLDQAKSTMTTTPSASPLPSHDAAEELTTSDVQLSATLSSESSPTGHVNSPDYKQSIEKDSEVTGAAETTIDDVRVTHSMTTPLHHNSVSDGYGVRAQVSPGSDGEAHVYTDYDFETTSVSQGLYKIQHPPLTVFLCTTVYFFTFGSY